MDAHDEQPKLARQIGASETAVRRAEKAGRVKREPDGAWDIAKVRTQWSRNTDLDEFGLPAGGNVR